MGTTITKIAVFLRLKKSPDVYKKELEGINKEILEKEQRKAKLEYQYNLISEFIVSYSRLLYLIITLVFFFSSLPSTFTELILFCGPILVFYVLLTILKKSLKWYFDHEIEKNAENLALLLFKKANILAEVKERVQFIDAQNIMEEYCQVENLNKGLEDQTNRLAHIYVKRKRASSVDSVVKYILNEEKENALICKYCQCHNGLALEEEYKFTKFRCCRCFQLNEPKLKKMPDVPES